MCCASLCCCRCECFFCVCVFRHTPCANIAFLCGANSGAKTCITRACGASSWHTSHRLDFNCSRAWAAAHLHTQTHARERAAHVCARVCECVHMHAVNEQWGVRTGVHRRAESGNSGHRLLFANALKSRVCVRARVSKQASGCLLSYTLR